MNRRAVIVVACIVALAMLAVAGCKKKPAASDVNRLPDQLIELPGDMSCSLSLMDQQRDNDRDYVSYFEMMRCWMKDANPAHKKEIVFLSNKSADGRFQSRDFGEFSVTPQWIENSSGAELTVVIEMHSRNLPAFREFLKK